METESKIAFYPLAELAPVWHAGLGDGYWHEVACTEIVEREQQDSTRFI
jgi:hypothetical protein